MSDSPSDKLAKLFHPKSIALIGGSDRNTYSHLMHKNLIGMKYAGSVHVVNKRGAGAHGYPGVTSCRDIADPVDAAILLVPVDATMEVIEDAVAANVRNFVVISSGFEEIGPVGGQRQETLRRYAEENKLNILGPNCLGYRNYVDRVALGCIPYVDQIAQGSIAVISASGSVAFYAVQCAIQQGLGISHLIATGNEMSITTADVVESLLDDPRIKGFVLFLEAIRGADRFAQVADRARQLRKPIIVLKVGAQSATAAVAAAHTGALVGDDRIFNAVCDKYALVRVNDIEECIAAAGVISSIGRIDPPGVAAISISGGMCEILSDLAEPNGVTLPPFSEATRTALKAVVSDLGQTLNPIDLTGAAVRQVSLWQSVPQIVGQDPAIGLTVINLELPASATPLMPEALDYMGAATHSKSNPVLLMSNLSLPVNEFGHAFLKKHNIQYVAPGLHLGVGAIGRLLWWSDRVTLLREPSAALQPYVVPRDKRPNTERAVLEYLAECGVPVVPAKIATTAEEAVAAAREHQSGSVVLKILSPDIAHKTDIGGVKLNIRGDAAVRAAFGEILGSVKAAAPAARIEGVIVSPFRGSGLEFLVGVTRDPLWGCAIAFGLGGVWVEALDDTAVRLLPASKQEILSALKELRSARLLEGFRATPPVDLDLLAAAIAAIGRAAVALGPELETLEVNPLWVRGDRVEALDALAVWIKAPCGVAATVIT
jgi:acyl-CoA synthetase (NDP forming)